MTRWESSRRVSSSAAVEAMPLRRSPFSGAQLLDFRPSQVRLAAICRSPYPMAAPPASSWRPTARCDDPSRAQPERNPAAGVALAEVEGQGGDVSKGWRVLRQVPAIRRRDRQARGSPAAIRSVGVPPLGSSGGVSCGTGARSFSRLRTPMGGDYPCPREPGSASARLPSAASPASGFVGFVSSIPGRTEKSHPAPFEALRMISPWGVRHPGRSQPRHQGAITTGLAC